jgi:hypothetical protein
MGKTKHSLGHIPLLFINGKVSLSVDTEIKAHVLDFVLGLMHVSEDNCNRFNKDFPTYIVKPLGEKRKTKMDSVLTLPTILGKAGSPYIEHTCRSLIFLKRP